MLVNMIGKLDSSDQSHKALLRTLLAYKKATDENILCSITDSKGIIIYVNKIFCKVSKYSKSELLGKSHNIVNANFHPTTFFKHMWETIKRGKTWRGEVKNKAKDGSYYWLDSVIIPIKDEKGTIIKYFSLRILITDKKQIEEERNEHIRTLKEMLFMTSHHVRQPIANILGLASLLNNEQNSQEENFKIVEYIKQSALSLDEFTRELTTFISDITQEKEVKSENK